MSTMNRVTCLVCNTTIESMDRHDFVVCKCPEESHVFVDGGDDYVRRGWSKKAHWREEATGEEKFGEEFGA